MTNGPRASADLRGRITLLNSLRLVFSALAVGLIVFGLFALREVSRSRGWVDTDGKVIASNVNEFTAKSGRATYRPMVVFSYTVGPVRYMSTRLAFRDLSSSSRDDAAKLAGRYRVGASVRVFYDPQDPEHAVLDRGINPYLPILAGGAFAMLAVWMRIVRGRAEKQSGVKR